MSDVDRRNAGRRGEVRAVRRSLVVSTALLAALIPAAPAAAASLRADRACYVEGQPMRLQGSGFLPGAPLAVGGTGTSTLTGTADAAGAFGAILGAPDAGALGVDGVGRARLRITATDTATGLQAATDVSVAAFAFGTSSGLKSARARRTWRFSGFVRSTKPIYGHFRHRGRTYANYRFGVPRGACGLLTARAPGIPVRNPRGGKWTVQIDQRRTYSRTTRPRLTSSTTVFLVPR